jgi:hypothetical protein
MYPCPHCQIGNLHPSPAFLCGWHEGQFISAPDFPAWVCDVCGQREYDQQAMFELNTILQVDRQRRVRRAKSNYRPNQQPPNLSSSGRRS